MRQLVKRFLVLVIVVAATVAVGWWSWRKLHERRYPQQAIALRFLEDRLGKMTREQRRLAGVAMARDPLYSMLAAEADGWSGLRSFVDNGPTDVLTIQRLALDAGLHDGLDCPTAVRFSNAAFTQYVMLDQVAPGKGQELLNQLPNLAPEEYGNVGFDSSYLMIAPRLDVRHRETFRKNQEVLTPLIAAADPSEWNRLMEKYTKALPRVAEIARDQKLGQLYAMVYMLHTDDVEAMKGCGIPERDSIEFVGINAASMEELKHDLKLEPAVVAEQVKRLRGQFGPDGETSLFQWACCDSSIFWLIAHAQRAAKSQREKAFEKSITVLNHYAGGQLPLILTHFASNDACFCAAVDALVQFDQFDSKDESVKQAAARFLNYFQKDPAFKAALAEHGAKLIPALGSGRDGKSCRGILAEIVNNGKNIGKYVTPDGKPITGKPWWTWIPGGSIVYLIDEIAAGQDTSPGDWAWAGTDAVILFPAAKATMLWRLGSRTATGAGTSVLARESVAVGKELAGKTIGAATWRDSMVLLYNGGMKVSKPALEMTKKAISWMTANPGYTTIAAVTVLYAIYPEKVKGFPTDIEKLIRKGAADGSKIGAEIAIGLPGAIIGALWDRCQQLVVEHPMLAPLFYFLTIVLIILIVLLPLVALRLLLPEVFHLLSAWAAVCIRVLAMPVAALAKSLKKQNRPAS